MQDEQTEQIVAIDTTDRPSCPLCRSQDIDVYLEGTGGALAAAALGSSRKEVAYGQILRCRRCTFGFSALRPTPETLSALYQELDSTVYQAEVAGRLRTAARHLNIVHRYRTSGRLLDVGCASGIFLHHALETGGWQVVGIEPAQVLCEEARTLLGRHGDVHCSTLEETPLPASSFDVVTLWDVLEHVADPVSFLRQCRSLLRPGGYLFVNVPDLDSLQARLLGARWPLFLIEHLNYFNPRSLKRCGEQAGLTWQHFGRRPASFSLGYVLYRLAQHHIPGTAWSHRLIEKTGLGNLIFPVPMGEVYGVWQRP